MSVWSSWRVLQLRSWNPTCTFSNVHMTKYKSSTERWQQWTAKSMSCSTHRTAWCSSRALPLIICASSMQETNPPCHLAQHRPTSNNCRRTPLPRRCMRGQKSYFHESYPNRDFIVRFVKLVHCLIFNFKRDLMLIFIKIVICLYSWFI